MLFDYFYMYQCIIEDLNITKWVSANGKQVAFQAIYAGSNPAIHISLLKIITYIK